MSFYNSRNHVDPPDAITFSSTWVVGTLALAAGIVSALGWVLLRCIPDTSAERRAARLAEAEGRAVPVQVKRGRWSGRGLDGLWFWYFIAHIPITLCVDCQSVLPPSLIPAPLKAFSTWYNAWSRDPAMSAAGRGLREWAWFDVFLAMELYIQVPCFIIGAIMLWRNDKRVYPLLIAYATTCATTTTPVLYYLLSTNAVSAARSTAHPVSPPLSSAELASLLASYVPFLVLPLIMLVDVGGRTAGIVGKAQRAGLASTSAPAGAASKEGKEGKKRR